MQIGKIQQLSDSQKIEWLQSQLIKNPAKRDMIKAAIAKLQHAPVEVSLPGNDVRTWHLMRRDDGSICLYWTKEDDPTQYVVWDSLDGEK